MKRIARELKTITKTQRARIRLNTYMAVILLTALACLYGCGSTSSSSSLSPNSGSSSASASGAGSGIVSPTLATTSTPAATATIGSGGGTILVTSGPLKGTSITIPAGAVIGSVLIGIQPGSSRLASFTPAVSAGPAVAFSPTGMGFFAPLNVTIPFNSNALNSVPGATTASVVILHTDASGTRLLVPASIDPIAGTVSFQISGFSTVQPVIFSAAAGSALGAGISTPNGAPVNTPLIGLSLQFQAQPGAGLLSAGNVSTTYSNGTLKITSQNVPEIDLTLNPAGGATMGGTVTLDTLSTPGGIAVSGLTINTPGTYQMTFTTPAMPGFSATSGTFVVSGSSPTPTPTPAPAMFGNGAQGSMIISSNTDWSVSGVPGGGAPQFTSFTVNSGVTLTVPSGVDIRCTGAATINGTIVANNWIAGIPSTGTGTAGISGTAAVSGASTGAAGISMSTAAAIVVPGTTGGGNGAANGGPSGGGGGTFGLRAFSGITIGSQGLISATVAQPAAGGTAQPGGGGGGGGVVVLVWGAGSTLVNNGTPGIDCSGGTGGNSGSTGADVPGGAGGGGGIVRLIGPGANTPAPNAVAVNGGAAGTSLGISVAGLGGGACGGAGGAGNNFALPGAGASGLIIPTNVPDPSTIVPVAP